MTVIAAIAAGGRVVMGCDTATDSDGTAIYTTRGKIARFRTADDELVLIGAAGNAGILATLRHRLKIENSPRGRGRGRSDRWADELAESIAEILADVRPPLLSTRHEGGAATLDGTMLVGWRHCLWIIGTHTAMRPHTDIAAIGSGRDIALGSMHTSMSTGVERRLAVEEAVRWASMLDSGCGIDERGPLVYVTDGKDWAE